MMRSKRRTAARRRSVAVIVESSIAGGRKTLQGITQYVREAGHWSLHFEPGHLGQSATLPNWLQGWHGDGMLVHVRNKKVARQVIQFGIPAVALHRPEAGGDIPFVEGNDRTIGETAANYLLEHKLRAFGFCGLRNAFWSLARCDSFREVLARAGCETHVYTLPPSDSQALFSNVERERLARWIEQLPKPIGLLACNDWVGQRVLNACRRAKVMVPEEAAVLGVDNDETMCDLCEPMLSSIEPNHDRVGYHAAELLDRLMQGKPAPGKPVVVGTPRIVVRRSTDLQTIADRDVVAAVRFIRENACQGIHVEDVAAHVALSYRTLHRRFEQFLSRSVGDEIHRVRMERVRELLTGTEMTLAQIASATGFQHQEYLGAVFKAQTGMTLRQFREANTYHPSSRIGRS